MPSFIHDEHVIAWLLGICLCITLAFAGGAIMQEREMFASCKQYGLYVTDRGAMQCAVADVPQDTKPQAKSRDNT